MGEQFRTDEKNKFYHSIVSFQIQVVLQTTGWKMKVVTTVRRVMWNLVLSEKEDTIVAIVGDCFVRSKNFLN